MKIKDTIAEYHSKKALSKTKLWRLLSRTPAYYKYVEEHGEPETAAMIFGSALHKMALEPNEFSKEYVIAPPIIDRRTKDGKAAYAEWLNQAGDRAIISADDMADIMWICESIRHNELAAYLTYGEVETSYYWQDESTNLPLQVRPDCFKVVNGRGVIVDLKTCNSADTNSFMRMALNLGYDMQAAMYKAGVEQELGIECDFVFLAVEKEPPYMINILQPDVYFMEHGEDRFRQALDLYKECSESNNWWGYNGRENIINPLSLPAWA